MREKSNLSPYEQPIFLLQPPPPPHGGGFSLNSNVSPSILLIIIILAIIFFISGLLHLLVRYLLRPNSRNRDPDEIENVTALEGQLQQLFNLHDAGVDQSFIDTLPIFYYKSIIGAKEQSIHFDCAVCLCEFEVEDKLRLLPKCSHAFHMECIDTWLLSHSTCPLCRSSLLPDYSLASPIVLVLESGGESSRELIQSDCEINKSCEIQENDDNEEKVVKIKLGKFRNGETSSSISNSISNNEFEIDSRRCFSMGSFAYIMDENTSLHVPIRIKNRPGHRVAMSECGLEEAFRFSGIQTVCNNAGVGNKIDEVGKRESFSFSKIWLRGKDSKDKRLIGSGVDDNGASSRRAVSFRFPNIGIDRLVHHQDCDEQNHGSNIMNSQANNSNNAQSFGRRTLIWLMGRQNRVVHSNTFSSASNVV